MPDVPTDVPGPDPPTYRLILRALPDDVPASVRFRRLLKLALRSFGMRCVRFEELPPARPAPPRPQPRSQT
jgi:hypothetical protein